MELIYLYCVVVLLSPLTLGFDFQIQGKIHVEDDMIEKLFSIFQSKYNIRVPRGTVNTTQGINQTSETNFISDIDKVNIDDIDTTIKKVGGLITKTGILKEFEDFILKKQTEKLRKIGKFVIHKQLNINVYTVSLTLIEVIDNFKHNFNQFFNSVYNLNIKHPIEKDYLYLNIIDSTNRIFSVNAKGMLHKIARDNNKHEKSILKRTHHQIDSIIMKEKRENLNYICSKLSICRTYPAYSNSLVEFLHIITHLSTTKLDVAVIVLENLFVSNKETFRSTINHMVKENIRNGFKSSNTNAANDFFTNLKSDIEFSYNIFDSVTKTAVLKKKCLRILLDIIDKTIEDYYEIVSTAFEKVKVNIKEWNRGHRNDFDVFLKEFFEDVVIVPIKYYLTPWSKNEISVLIKVLSNDKLNQIDYKEYSYLFTNGSKCVSNEPNFIRVFNLDTGLHD